MQKEYSSGGLVLKRIGTPQQKVLMVRVCNLEQHIVWTFPKGHLENTETSEQAAVREVLEETGWFCKVRPLTKKKKIFKRVRYSFIRGKEPVKKKVDWFLMEPVKKIGQKDPKEILQVGWFSLQQAEKKVSYLSDIKLLRKLRTVN